MKKFLLLLLISLFALGGCNLTPPNPETPINPPVDEEEKPGYNEEEVPPLNPGENEEEVPPLNPGENEEGELPPKDPDQWDDLGGGGTGDQTEENEITVEGIPVNKKVENLKLDDFVEDLSIVDDFKKIDLDTLEESILTIEEEGTYILSGTLNGAVMVDGSAENIVVILNGVTIKTLDSQPYPAITFKKHSGVRILYVADGTSNYLSDSIGDTNLADEGCAVIQAKKSDLVIAGNGILNLKSYGEETTGIKVKKDLFIFNTVINIDVNDNGIKSGSTMGIYNAVINIKASNDGIKTDVEAESLDDNVVSDIYAGFLYIKNSDITLEVLDNGIEANSYLKINNTSSHTITVITNGGAPTNITETSSDNADGKAIRTSGIKYVDEETEEETDLASTIEYNYLLVILGGKYIINSNDDAITSKGNLVIASGDFDISSGDDGIHAEYITTILNGNIKVNKSYEALEGACVEVYNGVLDLTSVDDGINAANADLKNYPYNIYIGGGVVYVNAGGDGIDSNGTVEIAGGTIIVNGPTDSMNGSLDADRGILVNGGNLIAVGPLGMIETPSNNSKQCCIVLGVNQQSGNTLISVKDQNGNILFETITLKVFRSVVISLESFVLGETYTVEIGTASYTFTLNNILTNQGVNQGPGGPGNPGSGGPGGRPPRM